MRRQRTPPEKKQLDYEEQMRPLLEVVRESLKRHDVEDLTAEAMKRVREYVLRQINGNGRNAAWSIIAADATLGGILPRAARLKARSFVRRLEVR